MKNFFLKNSIIFLSLFFISCATKNNQPPQIRLVDMQGKSHSVVTKTPELNNQALAMQKMPSQNYSAPVNQTINPDDSDFAVSSSQSMQQSLQSGQFSRPAPRETSNEMTEISATNNSIVGANEVSQETVEYDLTPTIAAPKVEKSLKKHSKKIPAKKSGHKSVAVSGKKFYVQVGSFINQGNADSTLSQMEKFHAGKVEVVEGEKTMYRVLLGPFANRTQANLMVKKITNSGSPAILVRSK